SFGRSSGSPVAETEGCHGFTRGSAVVVCDGGDWCADAFGECLTNGEDAVEPADADTQLVPGFHHLGGLGLLAVHPYMPGTACGRRRGAGLVDADRPEPAVDAHRGIHQRVLVRNWAICCHRSFRLRRVMSAPAMMRP